MLSHRVHQWFNKMISYWTSFLINIFLPSFLFSLGRLNYLYCYFAGQSIVKPFFTEIKLKFKVNTKITINTCCWWYLNNLSIFSLILEMYSSLQLNTNYLSKDNEEISLPAVTSEGKTTLNELKVMQNN